MCIIIRDMRKSDWPDVARIYLEGIHTGLATFETKAPAYSDWDSAHLRICRLVAVENESVVGWVALSPYSKRAIYRGVAGVSVYVAASHGGKGVGTELMRAMIAQSESDGVWTLQSSIMANNTPSLKLHAKCGFRQVGLREKIGRDQHGVWRDTIVMERRSKTVGIDDGGNQ